MTVNKAGDIVKTIGNNVNMKKSKQEIIDVLTRYFEKEDSVLLAFLFGSVSKGRCGALSDIDIAVYLKNDANEIRIWCEVERLLGHEVDILVLNRAMPTVAWEAIRGVPLAMKDRGLYLDLILDLSRDATDLIDRNIDMWRLKEEIKCQV